MIRNRQINNNVVVFFKFELTLFTTTKRYKQPAKYERLLSIDPDSDYVSILLVVVVSSCANTGPEEPQV